MTDIDVKPEMIEKAAKALADDWNPERDPVLAAMFRDYAQTALTAVLPEVIRQAKTEAWDEGRTAGAGMGVGIGERIVGTRSDWPAVPKNPYRQEDES